ncbi:hypothetical protein [Paraburkholderia caballeronis]|uniref:hypothetical protein n=1 Tax=Paraburkholderia caballeronis TaxID=416943 RepID=UPI0010667E8D|nr:hypothetical protein [Paraburkholderia caballeronis]TDV04681.1 hypothetical protein C7408_13143 [Paraburkholderia caballeronis]TDV07924.1 hypothetical protein C7406_13343 [Paraburkholderia caballeronis]TDV18215.1 hypothetical protein C7404_13143 [Paraburkholderia caballeronis]
MKLKAPDNCGGFHAEGTDYAISQDGTIDVPPHLVLIAKSHGFSDHSAAGKRGRKNAADTAADTSEA